MNEAAVLYSEGKQDECYTPAYAVRALLPHLPKGKIYWCPFDTEESQFVQQLVAAGHRVEFSHISQGQDHGRRLRVVEEIAHGFPESDGQFRQSLKRRFL